MENQRWPWATNWRRSQQHLQSSRKEDSDSSDHYGPKNHDDGDGSSFKRLSKLDQQRSKDGWTSTKVSLRERLSHFTWCWFECTMSTGALAVLLGIQIVEHPHDSSTIMRNMILRVLGSGFYVLQVLLFGLFCALITARFCIRPAALKASLHHPQESFFFGTLWVSIALILDGTQQYGVHWLSKISGGDAQSLSWRLTLAIEVAFWIYAGGALQLVIFQYHVIFDEVRLPVAQQAMPTWILPAYPFIVMGLLATLILESSVQELKLHEEAAPMLIGGIVFAGLGWCLAFLMYTIYFTRLINGALPEASKRPDMFVAVGPAGYTASALAGLGMQAPKVIPATYLGITSGVPTGDLWKAMSVPAAMFVWMIGFWFLAQAAVSTLRGAPKMRFTLSCWALIFPNAGLTIGMAQIGRAIDSERIQNYVVPAATVVLVVIWLLVAAMNVRAVWRGDLLWPGKDEDMEGLEDEGRWEEKKARHKD
ncbi:c4-dicarboxylate transporter malic acid transport protein [Apiospora kogelbergensis]|uniref:c4-dicarboxylate transporter malic acid transport protein n=1 Tax=Apiospora kogelbergensis TaxID=1337665 RepID=UPI003130DD10